MPEDIVPDVGAFYFYLEAFKELSSCRPMSFGIGPIPFTAIVDYSKIYEVEDFDEFIYLIRRMDSKFIKLENNKQSKDNGSRKPSTKSRN